MSIVRTLSLQRQSDIFNSDTDSEQEFETKHRRSWIKDHGSKINRTNTVNTFRIPRKVSNYSIPTSREDAKKLILDLAVSKDSPLNERSLEDPSKSLDAVSKRDPVQNARELFDETAIGFTRHMVCPIIGKGTVYNQQVLVAYLEFFDFKDVTLDEAFRKLCAHLHLTGETQAIDRILHQMSIRYWDCNKDNQATLQSSDVVYCIVFSMVLLNTDLNSVAATNKNHRKMNCKAFVKNTMDLILTMMKDDDSRTVKRDLEFLLRDIYESVKEVPILQAIPSKSVTSGLKGSPSWASLSPSRLGSPRSPFSFMMRGRSTDALHSISSTSTSPRSPNESTVMEGVLIRKHVLQADGERASIRRWTKFWCSLCFNTTSGVELAMYRLTFFNGGDKEFAEDEIIDRPSTRRPTSDIKEEEDSKEDPDARPTRSKSTRRGSETTRKFVASPLSYPILSSPTHDYKISNQEPEVLSLIHAFTLVCSTSRENTFSLTSADNQLFYFQAPSTYAMEAWVTSMNWWSARKSREPMRGAGGNVNYGFEFGTGLPQKFAVWNDLAISTRLLSVKTEGEQLKAMKRQLETVENELVVHENNKALMTVALVDHLQAFIALTNLDKRSSALAREVSKYQAYVRALSQLLPEVKQLASPF